jgi:general secretion pathway protein M
MKEWFESLEERERIFVAAAAVFVVVAIFYLAIWMPLSKGQESMASEVEMWSEQLAELQPLVDILQTDGTGPSAGSAESLVVIVDRTVRDHDGLSSSLQRSQPTGNVVRVVFENAAFDDLILWLGALNQRNGLRVQTANFSATAADKKGRVNSTLTLER